MLGLLTEPGAGKLASGEIQCGWQERKELMFFNPESKGNPEDRCSVSDLHSESTA